MSQNSAIKKHGRKKAGTWGRPKGKNMKRHTSKVARKWECDKNDTWK